MQRFLTVVIGSAIIGLLLALLLGGYDFLNILFGGLICPMIVAACYLLHYQDHPLYSIKFRKEGRRPRRSLDNELGSSDLATSEHIKKWLKKNDPGLDTVLSVETLRSSEGVLLRKGKLIIPAEERNRHILVIAKTGSGKTTKLILPILYSDCLSKERSTVIIDAKPEMWDKLAGMTQELNPAKKILLFNPLDTKRSLSWNIVGKVENDTDAKLIANTVVMATDNPAAKADSPFFRNVALQMLNGMMVGLLEDPSDVLSMPRLHQLAHSGKENLCLWLEAHPNAIRMTKTFVELARSGSQNADTVLSELTMRIQAWDLNAIRATTFQNELDLDTLIEEPTLLIVELRESEVEMLRPIANVIVIEILRHLTKRAEMMPKQTLPRPVGLVIDEFASALGRLPDIHVKLNTLRSRNISIVAAIQSIGQVKANYEKDADSVLAGFNTKILMPMLDFMDSEWASKESGQMTVRFLTKNKGSNRKVSEVFTNLNRGTQEMVQQRAVLTPDEIGRPSDNINTFFMPNTPPFQGYLVPFYKVPEMAKRIGSGKVDFNLRDAEITYVEPALPDYMNQDSSGKGHMSAEELKEKLEEIKGRLSWEDTTGVAREWWITFEEQNAGNLQSVYALCEELEKRGASIPDFFLAYTTSNCDNIPDILKYLDYVKSQSQKLDPAGEAENLQETPESNFDESSEGGVVGEGNNQVRVETTQVAVEVAEGVEVDNPQVVSQMASSEMEDNEGGKQGTLTRSYGSIPLEVGKESVLEEESSSIGRSCANGNGVKFDSSVPLPSNAAKTQKKASTTTKNLGVVPPISSKVAPVGRPENVNGSSTGSTTKNGLSNEKAGVKGMTPPSHDEIDEISETVQVKKRRPAEQIHFDSYVEMGRKFLSEGKTKDFDALLSLAEDDPMLDEMDCEEIRALSEDYITHSSQ